MRKSSPKIIRQLLSTHRALLGATHEPLQRLARRTGLTTKLSIRRGNATLTLFCAMPDTAMFVAGSVGGRFHLAHGSSGSVLLSGLSDAQIERLIERAPPAVWRLQTPMELWARIMECRAFGFCVDPGQFHPNVHGLAAPLCDPAGRIVASVTLMGFAHDLNGSTMDQHAKTLLAATKKPRVPSVK